MITFMVGGWANSATIGFGGTEKLPPHGSPCIPIWRPGFGVRCRCKIQAICSTTYDQQAPTQYRASQAYFGYPGSQYCVRHHVIKFLEVPQAALYVVEL